MKVDLRYLAGGLALLAVLAVGAYMATRGQAVTLVQASAGDMVQSIVTTGRVAMRTRNDISSGQSLRVDAVEAKEGDTVQAGQVLIRLHPQEAKAALEQAQALALEAQLRVDQVPSLQAVVNEQQLAQAMAADRLAQQGLERARALVAQGFVSSASLNEADRAAQSSQAAVKAAQAQVQSSRRNGLEEQLARSKVAQTNASVRASQERLAQTLLRSPVTGQVLTRNVEVGDLAGAGRALMTVVSAGSTQLHATVDERNMKWLRLGQSAVASADADPTRRFKATVMSIAPSIDPLRGTVEVKLEVEPSAANALRPDMTVSIEIVVASSPNAIRVPTEALVLLPDGSASVWLVSEGRAQRRAVTLGLQGLGSTQIVSGIAAGDTLAVPSTGLVLTDGDRVRGQATAKPKALGTMPMPGLTN